MDRPADNVSAPEKDAKESGRPIWLADAELGDRCHVCAFFKSRVDEYRVLLPSVREGLERGEKNRNDLTKFTGDVVVDVMRTHPMIIIGGILQEKPVLCAAQEVFRRTA